MRKSQKMNILACFALVVIIAVGAVSVLARPSFGSNCAQSGCHADNTIIGLSSNATGTVLARVGEPFVLILDADSGVNAISIPDNVANNDQFTPSTDLIEDDNTGDTNANDGEITAEVSITPLADGTFTLQIWAMEGGTIGTPLDIAVQVEESTITTTTTTTTTPDGLSEEERKQLWYTMMYIFIPATGVILAVLGFVIIRRAGSQ